MLRVVLDTNVILASIYRKSRNRFIINQLFLAKYFVLVNPEIFLEYEEKIIENFGKKAADEFLEALMFLPNVIKVATYFDFNLINKDKEDNKFVNCAIAGNANYLVTNDKHFNMLKPLPFPKINVINIDEFMEILNQSK